jgi:hypothetical protein
MSLKGGILTRRPLCYTPDGKAFFAACGRDVRVYSAASGEHVGTLVGHTAPATAVALDPASEGSQVRRRPPPPAAAAAARRPRTSRPPAPARGCPRAWRRRCLAGPGQHAARGRRGGLPQRSCAPAIPAPRTTPPALPSPSRQVYTSSQDGTLKLWDYMTGDCLRSLAIGQPVEHMVRARRP